MHQNEKISSYVVNAFLFDLINTFVSKTKTRKNGLPINITDTAKSKTF